MIKTVKGKVIAGTLVFGLVAGSGVAFGASNAGERLQNWYNSQFGQATTSGVNEVAGYVEGQIDGIANEYNGLKTDATNSINTTGATSGAVATSNINNESAEHIAAINQQKAAISSHMATQFDELSTFAAGLIDEAGRMALDAATNDLTAHTGAKGGEAIAALETDLNGVKGDALTQLEAAIGNAKSELQTQLANEKNATVAEIKAMIDAKINQLRTQITQVKNNLVAEQQRLITAKAIELETAAKREMQSVVDGI